MKRIRCGVWLALVATVASAGQQQTPLPGPDAADIVRIAGGETEAGGMIARTIARQLDWQLKGMPATEIAVFGEQIRPEWLPLTPGARYVVLDRAQARERFQSCAQYLFVRSVTREDAKATVTIGLGNRCRTAGSSRSFQRGPNGWEEDPGIGAGSLSAVAHCECP